MTLRVLFVYAANHGISLRFASALITCRLCSEFIYECAGRYPACYRPSIIVLTVVQRFDRYNNIDRWQIILYRCSSLNNI